MKKLLAVILSISILACVFALPVHAVDDSGKSTYLFMDKFYATYGGFISEFNENEAMTDAAKEQYYKELFYHYDESGAIDWTFVFSRTDAAQQMICYSQIGNRLFYQLSESIPFSLGYGIYDVEDNKFYDINQVWKNEKYSEAVQLFEKECDNGLVNYKTSVKIGDVNNDGFITVSDATYLQKCIAGLEDYPVTPELQLFINQRIGIDPKGYITFNIEDFYDVNKDGTVSVGDATKIQRISAEFND